MSSGNTIQDVLSRSTAILERAGVASAKLDASLLLAHIMEIPREAIVIQKINHLDNNVIIRYNDYISRRAAHEPVAYILGRKEFWSLDFFVTRDTLIPRPDSETLIEAALRRVEDRAKNTSILDMGTGTGCLLIALLKELPSASGIGVDINERALQVAGKNAVLHGVHERTEFMKSHWCDALNRTFDLIISNPPYIADIDRGTLMQDVMAFEPHAALFAGVDGLDAYRVIAPQVAKRLKPAGMFVGEIGEYQAAAVRELLQAEGLTTESPEKDLAGKPRCIVAHKPNSTHH